MSDPKRKIIASVIRHYRNPELNAVEIPEIATEKLLERLAVAGYIIVHEDMGRDLFDSDRHD